MLRSNLRILGGFSTSVPVVDTEEGVLEILFVLSLLAVEKKSNHEISTRLSDNENAELGEA